MAAPKHPGGNAGKGRPVGSRNKFPSDIKAMILAALNKAGGERYLVRQAEANPTAFLTLLGKILPTTINATIKREVTEYTADELRAIIARGSRGIARAADSAGEPPQLH